MYLDDIVVYGTDPTRVWQETKVVLERLARAGFMINTTKSLNLCKQYSVAARVCSISELSLRVLVVLTHPTGTSFGLASTYFSWYSTPP